MPKGINSTVPPHLAELLSKATRTQLIAAVQNVADYYERCIRGDVSNIERWQTTLTDALHVQLADARHPGSSKLELPPASIEQYERRDYSAVYSDQ